MVLVPETGLLSRDDARAIVGRHILTDWEQTTGSALKKQL